MKRKDIKKRLMEHFFVSPTARLRVRQVERDLNLPLPSVIRYCRELEKEGILKKIKTGDVAFYTADRANRKFLLEKKLFNLKQLYDTGLVDYLKEELHNPAIIVFGSYSKGEDIENSDIDLFIETTSNKDPKPGRFEKMFNRKIQIFTQKSIKEISNHHLANNIINGVILNGFIEVFT